MMRMPEKFVSCDVEATGLNPYRGAKVFSAAAAFPNGDRMFWRGEFSGFKRLMEDPTVDKIFHNAKYDVKMIHKMGITVRGQVWDTMINCHLLNGRDAGKGLSLDKAVQRYLPPGEAKVVKEINDWFDENKIPKTQRGASFKILPPELLKKRNVGDADLTLKLWMKTTSTVMHYFPLLLEQEHRLLPVVRRMEDRGIEIDEEEIEKQIVEYDEIEQECLRWLEAFIGWDDFNPNSPEHKKELLKKAEIYDKIPNRTKKSKKFPNGQPKMDDYNLRQLHHPAAHTLLLCNAAHKMRTTFLQQMLRESVRGVVHPNFNQLGTTTGRFSCSGPNLQNIPIEGDRRTAYTQEEADEAFDMTGIEYKPHLKRIFKVRPGYCHIHSDKKQAEMAALAHYTSDPILIKSFESGESVHDAICQALYGEWTKGLKTRTKAVVFGFMYGAGNATLARKIGGTLSEAISTRQRLARTLPSLPKWSRELENQIRQRGYVETIHGRRHYLRPDESYIAVNRMCQGTVGDEIKSRMIALQEHYDDEGWDATVLLNIHDDIGSEIPIEVKRQAVPDIHRIMHESSVEYKLTLPSSLDITYTRWSDLKEIEDVNQIPEPVLT